MANYEGKDFKVSFNATDITANVRDPLTLSREAVVEDITPFGVQDQVQGYAGLRKVKDVPVGGLYDDTATTGTDALFVGIGATGTLLLTWGGSKTSSMSSIVKVYDRIADPKGKFSRYKATLSPTGAVTEV